MKTRPWPVVLLAALHVLAPLGNIVLSAWVQKMPLTLYWAALIHSSDLLSLGAFFLALPLAGVALYLYREWSYAVVFGALTLSIVTNFQSWSKNPVIFPLWLFAAVVAVDVALVAYFLLPSVWTPYMDPKMRWWETKPRYRIKQRAHFSFKNGLEDCLVVDFSEGGIFLKCREPLQIGEEVELKLSLLGQYFHLRGQVVYHRARTHAGYGIRFTHTPETHRQARKLVAGFQMMEIPCRNARTLRDDFKDWTRRLRSTPTSSQESQVSETKAA